MIFTVTQGDRATWNVDFVDPVTGQRGTVTGGTLTLGYHQNKAPVTTVIGLIALGVRWTANWDSSPADLGYGTWSILATGSSIPSASGVLRVVTDP